MMALTCVEERKGLSQQQNDRDESKRKETSMENQNKGWKDCISEDNMQIKNFSENMTQDKASFKRLSKNSDLK